MLRVQIDMQVVLGTPVLGGGRGGPGVGLWLSQIWSDQTRCSASGSQFLAVFSTNVLYKYCTQILMWFRAVDAKISIPGLPRRRGYGYLCISGRISMRKGPLECAKSAVSNGAKSVRNG